MNLIILAATLILSFQIIMSGLAAYPGMSDQIGMLPAIGLLLIGLTVAIRLPFAGIAHIRDRNGAARPKA